MFVLSPKKHIFEDTCNLKIVGMRRNVVFYGIMALTMLLLGSCSSVDFTRAQLPNDARSFISKYYSLDSIDSTKVTIDKEYCILLKTGEELEFNSKGEWMEISLKKNDFPDALKEILPEKALAYISKNYPDSKIRKIEKTYPGSKNFGYRVRLNRPNNMELSFDNKGELSMNKPSEVNLPKLARLFMTKYFAEDTATFIEQDQNRNYIVYTGSGTQITFERKGNWEELKSRKRNLPETVFDLLPKDAIKYLNNNYNGQLLQKIEKKSYGFRVRLSKPDEIELSFSRSGTVIDDEFME